MGSLYRQRSRDGTEGRIYWCKYYVDGRPVRESTGTDKEKEAERFLKRREGAVAAGAPIAPRLDRIRYDELSEDLRQFYRTTGKRRLGEVEDRLVYLDRFFGGRRAASIGPAMITEYVAARQAQKTPAGTPPANRTINIELALLKRMLRLAYKQEKLLRVPPIEMLKDAPARQGFFEAHQFEAVRRRLPEDLHVAVTIAYTYGWRMRSEVLPLERRQLDLKTGTLRLDPGTTKNGEGRVVYLTPELKALLNAQVDRVDRLSRQLGRIVPYLFPRLRGRQAGQRRGGFAKRWQRACLQAGAAGRLLHDFRRTAVRNLERAGVARSVAMKITGHKTESVYRRYAIVSDADLQEATRKLAACDAAQGHNGGHNSLIALDSRPLTVQNP
jgi:integrase